MFESTMAGHLHLAHTNPSTMHSEAFMPSKSFLEWLDGLSGIVDNEGSLEDRQGDWNDLRRIDNSKQRKNSYWI